MPQEPLPIPDPVATDLQQCLADQAAVQIARDQAERDQSAWELAAQTAQQSAAALTAAQQTLAADYSRLQADLAALFGQNPQRPSPRR